MSNKLFELGSVYATRGVADRMAADPDFLDFCRKSFRKYREGDWGDMCREDKDMNDDAVHSGDGRIHGAYKKKGTTLWIITESDRSATTLLFPEEY